MISHRVGIDKLKIGLVFPDIKSPAIPGKIDPVNFYGLMEWVGSVIDDAKGKPQSFPRPPGTRPYFKRAKPPAAMTMAYQPFEYGRGGLAVRYGRHTGHHRAWLEFNPDKCDPGEFNAHLSLMLDQGFETLYRYGRVSYCEFFIDIDGEEFADYHFLDYKLTASNHSLTHCGTSYLGSLHGYRTVTVYDKAKELREVSGEILPHPRLRIEAKRKNGYGFDANQIHHIANPFTSMLVIPRSALAACSTPAATRLNHYLGCGMHLQEAIETLDSAQRSEALSTLNALVPAWWDPAELWKGYVESLRWVEVLRIAGIYGSPLPCGPEASSSDSLQPSKKAALLADGYSPPPPLPGVFGPVGPGFPPISTSTKSIAGP